MQIVSLLHNLMIVDYAVGHTGSAHDSYAFQSTQISQDPSKFLGPNDWIWADSAYPSEAWSVSPFKKPVGGTLTSDQRTFNYYVSKVRFLFYSIYFIYCNYGIGSRSLRTRDWHPERPVSVLEGAPHPNRLQQDASLRKLVDHHLYDSP